jgi:hypothetical protein
MGLIDETERGLVITDEDLRRIEIGKRRSRIPVWLGERRPYRNHNLKMKSEQHNRRPKIERPVHLLSRTFFRVGTRIARLLSHRPLGFRRTHFRLWHFADK